VNNLVFLLNEFSSVLREIFFIEIIGDDYKAFSGNYFCPRSAVCCCDLFAIDNPKVYIVFAVC